MSSFAIQVLSTPESAFGCASRKCPASLLYLPCSVLLLMRRPSSLPSLPAHVAPGSVGRELEGHQGSFSPSSDVLSLPPALMTLAWSPAPSVSPTNQGVSGRPRWPPGGVLGGTPESSFRRVHQHPREGFSAAHQQVQPRPGRLLRKSGSTSLPTGSFQVNCVHILQYV